MKSILTTLRNIICAALAGIGMLLSGCTKPKYTWSTEAEYYKIPIWKQHVRHFKKMKTTPNTSTVFIGDSMTEGFDLKRHLNSDSLINMGISGDFTSGVLRRIEYATRLQPKSIFIMIGINDILKSVPQDRIIKQYGEIIDAIQKDCPTARLYVQSNLPTTNMGGNEVTNQAVVERVRELNAFLIKKCTETGTTFINLYPIFEVESSHLKAEYTYDGLHLNDDGYKAWATQIKPLISRP